MNTIKFIVGRWLMMVGFFIAVLPFGFFLMMIGRPNIYCVIGFIMTPALLVIGGKTCAYGINMMGDLHK